MPIKKIKVLIVDDSLFFRTALKNILSNDNFIEIVDMASDAFDAEKKIKEKSPDVVTLDVEMPGMRGTEFLKKIMPKYPLPFVLVSSVNMSVFEALDAGAIDFIKKPDRTQAGNAFEVFCNELSVKIKIASMAKIRAKPMVPTVVSNLSQSALKIRAGSTIDTIIAIGASTGGTEATLEVIKQLPEDIPPVLITQHMPVGFTKMYADRLNKICKIKVSEAQNGDRVLRGCALIAAGDKHMTLEKDMKGYYVKCIEGERVSGHCPSVDVLFNSVAKKAGKNAIGVILTGMGRDGAEGLLNMKKAGAYTIGQDKESCVVYGMPMVAFDIGAVIDQAPCQRIAELIIRRLNKM